MVVTLPCDLDSIRPDKPGQAWRCRMAVVTGQFLVFRGLIP